MEDDRTKNRVMPLLFVGLLLLSFMNGVHADESTNEFVVDGRLQMVNLQPGQNYQQSLDVEEGTIVSVNIGCSSCQVQLDAGGTLSLIHI